MGRTGFAIREAAITASSSGIVLLDPRYPGRAAGERIRRLWPNLLDYDRAAAKKSGEVIGIASASRVLSVWPRKSR